MTRSFPPYSPPFQSGGASMVLLIAGMAIGVSPGAAVAQTVSQAFEFKPSGETRRIYLAAGGERIELVDAPRAVSRGSTQSTRVWVNNNVDPCEFGDPDGADDIPGTSDDAPNLDFFVFGFGTESGCNPFGFDPATNTADALSMWWGDVPADSRVNAIGVWVLHDLADENDDPTSVDGFQAVIGFVEGFNGTVPPNNSPAVPFAVQFSPPDSTAPLGYFAGQYFVIDLVDDMGGIDETFELGDSDGAGPSSGNFNANSFFDDPDDAGNPSGGVGLHDFGYYRTYFYPEGLECDDPGTTFILGSYGDVEYLDPEPVPGEPDFFSFVVAEDNGLPPGLSNQTARFSASIDPMTGLPVGIDGTAGFVGLLAPLGDPSPIDCSDGTFALPPFADWLELYFNEVGVECSADFNGDEMVNVLDIVDFISAWQSGLDFNGDMNVNILDVVDFITVWQDGCP